MAETPSLSATAHYEMAKSSGSLFTEDQLKRISRDIRQHVPNEDSASENDVKDFAQLLDDVFHAAEATISTASHRVAAWNTLSALIDQKPDDLNDAVWQRAFTLYLCHSENARPKSSKQLLATLGAALSRSQNSSNLRQSATKRLVEIILEDERHFAKASFQALAHFLDKGLLDLDDLLLYQDELGYACVQHLELSGIERLLYDILRWLGKGDFGSTVGHLISVILQASRYPPLSPMQADRPSSKSGPLWFRPLELALQTGTIEIDNLRTHVFPVLFKRSLTDYVRFLNLHGLQDLINAKCGTIAVDDTLSGANIELLYASLQSGKELGLLYDTEDCRTVQTSSSLMLPTTFIKRLLHQSSSRARLTGLSLLITSHSATRPLPPTALRLLQKHLYTFFADTDANFRGEVFSLMQRLMDRLRAITAVAARQKATTKHTAHDASDSDTVLFHHQSFLEWLLSSLSWELRPTASYQRHISALKTLSVIIRSGLDSHIDRDHLSKLALAETKWPFGIRVVTPGLRRQLLDLLLNPFDDVRQAAASILMINSTSTNAADHSQRFEQLQEAIGRAEHRMLSTGRADQADGVAHLYGLLDEQISKQSQSTCPGQLQRRTVLNDLLEKLHDMIKVARSNLPDAVNKYPLHGLLTSLRYVLVRKSGHLHAEEYINELVDCLQQVWHIVKPVLCDDAPEGYEPEDLEEASEASSKDTLSYCWRALKESSLLLGAIITTVGINDTMMVSLSDLCFLQLAELRHRGAFSTVAQTWIACCSKCVNLGASQEQSPLHRWYTKVITILSDGTTINTRRSAGIPALLCGLLIADKSDDLLPRAMDDLRCIAEKPAISSAAEAGSLSQVHALNCIKDVLKNSRLGERSERYLSQSLQLAAQSLRSPAWAVRNCGLMLFRAVIDRMLGTSEAHLEEKRSSPNRMSAGQSFNVLDTVLDLINTSIPDSGDITSMHHEGVFPALQLLERMTIPEDKRDNALAAVLALTVSPSMHIRDKAARTYAHLLDIEDLKQGILGGADKTDVRYQNALHGLLLTIKYLIRRLSTVEAGLWTGEANDADPVSSEPPSHWIHGFLCATHLYHETTCIVTKAAYVDATVEGMQFMWSVYWKHGHGQAQINYIQRMLNTREELQLALDAQYYRTEDYVLRAALARALCVELQLCDRSVKADEDGVSDVATLILALGKADADACCDFFETFFAHLPDESTKPGFLTQVMLSASAAILRQDFSLKLKLRVQRLMLEISKQQVIHEDIAIWFRSLLQSPGAMSSPLGVEKNQEYADLWLQMQAVAFEQYYRSVGNGILAYENQIRDWIHHCCTAIQGHGLFTREAAANAISRLETICQHLTNTSGESVCDLYFGVYDLSNDDDEDIRLLASATATRIIYADEQPRDERSLEPSCASERLAAFMLRRCSGGSRFIEEAFHRAFKVNTNPCPSVAEQMASLQAVDTALFAEEKQNLYIDEAREARFWSRVLMQVRLKLIPKALLRRFAFWTCDGLDVLITKATTEHDGTLGWTTKPEIFTLGLQVIYGVQLLLYLVGKGVKLPVRPSVLRLKLGRLAIAAEQSNLNILWRREIDSVVAEGVVRSLDRCRAGMSKVVNSVYSS